MLKWYLLRKGKSSKYYSMLCIGSALHGGVKSK